MPEGIVYPQGCRPIQEELGADELIRRLKVNSFVQFISKAYGFLIERVVLLIILSFPV